MYNILQMSFIGELAIVGAIATGVTAIIPYFSYVGYVYQFKILDMYKYKKRKRQLYRFFQESIDDLDMDKMRETLKLLKAFDVKYERSKVIQLKSKYKLTDEMLQNYHLFRLKFDPEYLITYGESPDVEKEEKVRLSYIKKREQCLDNLDRSKYDDIIDIEYEYKQGLNDLVDKEEEVAKMISNFHKINNTYK